ncbi:MAG: Rod shape-determining protein MreC [Candidatus Nomurabacteria bacterium]|nr:Rod shape-determining protein MreC [Candidatus Nomurabacteria bacterium]
MPRYNSKKKTSPLKAVNPWVLRTGVIVGVLLLIVAATYTVKKLFGKAPIIYGGTVAQHLLSKNSLISKVNEQQSTLTAYDAEITTLHQLQNENAALKEELGRTVGGKGILGHVVTLPNRSFYDSILIDAGSVEGIQPGAIVYAFNSIALGTISDVTDHTATVWLYSAAGRQTSGTAVENNVAVTLVGRGGGEYEVQLPRDVPFNVGDIVSLQSVQVASLAVVEKVITDPRDPFQRLLAKVPVNLQALKFVVVK